MFRASRASRASLLLAAGVAAAAAAPRRAQGQPPDSAAAPARAARPATRGDSASARAVARDLVGADDPRCDDLCRRERMLDSLYGKDRERRPAAAAPRKAPPGAPAKGP